MKYYVYHRHLSIRPLKFIAIHLMYIYCIFLSLQKSGKCIPKSWVCDADPDCGVGDTSDEGAHCVYPTCQPFEYTCDSSKRCIRLDYLCDGKEDCLDGSDELNCLQHCNTTRQYYCQPEMKCLSPGKVDHLDMIIRLTQNTYISFF